MSHFATLPADYHIGETVVHRAVGPCTVIEKESVAVPSYTIAQLGNGAKLTVVPKYVPVVLRPIATHEQIEAIFRVLQQPPRRRSFSYQRGKTHIRNDICSGNLVTVATALRDVVISETLDQFRQTMRDLALSILVPEIVIVHGTTPAATLARINCTIFNRQYAHLAAQ